MFSKIESPLMWVSIVMVYSKGCVWIVFLCNDFLMVFEDLLVILMPRRPQPGSFTFLCHTSGCN